MNTRLRSIRDRASLIAAVGLPLVTAAVLVPFRRSFPGSASALVIVVAVVAVAANGHRLAGWIAALSAAACFDFFLTQPYGQLNIIRRADVETTILLLLVGGAVTELAVRARRHHLTATTDAAYLTAIARTTDLVASGAPATAVVDQVTAQLRSLLSLRGCRFERAATSRLPRLRADGRLVVADGFWDLERFGFPRTGVEVLAGPDGSGFGWFVLDPVPGTLPSLAARQVAVILAGLAGAAVANDDRSIA